MTNIEYITLHASATPASMNIGADEIRDWHVNGNGWNDIGYHYVVRRDGVVEPGRPEHIQGAHVGGFNRGNLGVCLVGGIDHDGNVENNFTEAQWEALTLLMRRLVAKHPKAVIMGHNGWPGHESRGCPCFDWRKWRHNHRAAEPKRPTHWYSELDLEGP